MMDVEHLSSEEGEPAQIHLQRGMVICPDGLGNVGSINSVALVAAMGGMVSCPGCSNEHDAWSAVCKSIRDASDLWHPVALAGGGQTYTVVRVQRDRGLTLNLNDLGVPTAARVHRVLQTPYKIGVVLALPAQTLGRPGLPSQLYLHPVPVGGESSDWTEADIAFSVAWSPTDLNNRALELLASSLAAYQDNDTKRAVLDAHTAWDIELQSVVIPLLRSVGLPKNERLGTIQRLAVLEAMVHSLKLPTITGTVRAELHRLHSIRNGGQVAHGGNRIERSDIVEPLAGAVVALWWLWQTRDSVATGLGSA